MGSNNGWIGVDLDGTLAMYDRWRGCEHIGEPIKPMVDMVKKWISEGSEVKILTARAYDSEESKKAIPAIKKWCLKHIGKELDVTCSKDMNMIVLFDDRAVQVITNTGVVVRSFK